MARTKSKPHTHKYYRGWLGSERVWVCSECPHYLPKVMDTHINHRPSICWNCGEQFKMNPLSMAEENPVCDNCRFENTNQELPQHLLHKLGLNPTGERKKSIEEVLAEMEEKRKNRVESEIPELSGISPFDNEAAPSSEAEPTEPPVRKAVNVSQEDIKSYLEMLEKRKKASGE